MCDCRLCLTVNSLTVAWIYAAVRVLPFTNLRLISHDKIQMSRSGETAFFLNSFLTKKKRLFFHQ